MDIEKLTEEPLIARCPLDQIYFGPRTLASSIPSCAKLQCRRVMASIKSMLTPAVTGTSSSSGYQPPSCALAGIHVYIKRHSSVPPICLFSLVVNGMQVYSPRQVYSSSLKINSVICDFVRRLVKNGDKTEAN